MNLVIIYGKIVSEIEFKFIYDRYIDCGRVTEEMKHKHISLARCKVEILNGSVIEIYGYDDIADYMYRNLKEGENIVVEGRLESNMKIKCERLDFPF